MKQPTKSATILSAMFLGLGATQAHAAPSAKIQSLELLQENKITYEEFKALVGATIERHSLSTTVTSGNYGDTVTSGNYADTVTSANYADTVTSANYSNTITSGNYSLTFEEMREREALPMPIESSGK